MPDYVNLTPVETDDIKDTLIPTNFIQNKKVWLLLIF